MKTEVYILSNGNLVETATYLSAIGRCVVDVYFLFDHIQIYQEEFNYLFSDAECLGEL